MLGSKRSVPIGLPTEMRRGIAIAEAEIAQMRLGASTGIEARCHLHWGANRWNQHLGVVIF